MVSRESQLIQNGVATLNCEGNNIMSETVILSGQCQLVRETSHVYNLNLSYEIFLYERVSRGCCVCSRKRDSRLINLHDVYGAKVLRSNDKDDMAAYFQIFACPQKKKERKGERICFRVMEFDDVDLNLGRAREWVRAITWLVKDPAVDIAKIRGKHFIKYSVSSR